MSWQQAYGEYPYSVYVPPQPSSSNPTPHDAPDAPASRRPRSSVESVTRHHRHASLSIPQPEATDNPFHIIVSFHGYNELYIKNAPQLTLDDLRKIIWPLWPDGVESYSLVRHTCTVRFRNAPWDMSGPNVKHTYKFIIKLFRLFQRRGYSFQTTIHRRTEPRFIFQATKPDNLEFFLAYFSQEGRRLSLINPPQHVDFVFGSHLRSMFGRKVSSVDSEEEYKRVFEVKQKVNNVSEVDVDLFFLGVLRILNKFGFYLDASIPLSRKGSFGMRDEREILVFKGIAVEAREQQGKVEKGERERQYTQRVDDLRTAQQIQSIVKEDTLLKDRKLQQTSRGTTGIGPGSLHRSQAGQMQALSETLSETDAQPEAEDPSGGAPSNVEELQRLPPTANDRCLIM